MGIEYHEESGTYSVSFSKRHPITRQSKSLRRICNREGNPILSKAEAQRIYNELVIQIESSFLSKEKPSTSYREVLENFYEFLGTTDYSKQTIENYTTCLNAHTLKVWGSRPITSITTQEIRTLIKVTLEDRSPSQQKNVLKFIRRLFVFATEEGFVTKSPVPLMQFRMGNKIKPVLTEQQLKILLEKAKEYSHEWYPIWSAAVYTGMRSGELYALTWDKVDLDARKLIVSAAWNSKDGFKDLTKSGVDRVVEIAPPLLTIFRELRIKNADSNFVLPRAGGWTEGRQAEMLRAFLIGLGLPAVRFHDLRASWATVMLGKGIEPVKVMCMGGWKDLKTMMIYIRKAGIDIKGMTDNLVLHNPSSNPAQVFWLDRSSNLS